jgi:hypothetical protein
LYGTTYLGGTFTAEHAIYGRGTVFMPNAGLGAFVALQTTSGKVGATIKMLGTNLIGTTKVSFNGASATFTVNSTGTSVAATVPTGATSGTVQVVTPNGTLESNVVFMVN